MQSSRKLLVTLFGCTSRAECPGLPTEKLSGDMSGATLGNTTRTLRAKRLPAKAPEATMQSSSEETRPSGTVAKTPVREASDVTASDEIAQLATRSCWLGNIIVAHIARLGQKPRTTEAPTSKAHRITDRPSEMPRNRWTDGRADGPMEGRIGRPTADGPTGRHADRGP